MGLKVGMYVRLKPEWKEKICKIKECRNDGFIVLRDDDEYWLDASIIFKASFNLIDLIEVGDYVNGYYVEDVLENCVNIATGSNYFQNPTIYEININSIVTKEQFEECIYHVKPMSNDTE